MQTELNKVVTALQEFYAREAVPVRQGPRRAYADAPAGGASRKAVFGLGGRLRLQPARRANAAAAAWHASSRPTIELGKSVYPDIVVHQREIPNNLLAVEVRKATNHQPLGTRPAQAAGPDRSASVVRLLDRRAAFARQEAGDDRRTSISAASSIRRCPAGSPDG